MKFKTLALAAMMAVSAPSFATITTHDATEFGGSELVLLVTKASGSYAQDLGISINDLYSQLSTTGSFTQSVLGAQWDAYNAFAGDGGKWAIISVQALDIGLAPGETNVWTTRAPGQALGQIQNVQVNDTVGGIGYHFLEIDVKSGYQENPVYASNNTQSSYSDNITIALNGNGFKTTNDSGQASALIYLTPSNDVGDRPALFSTVANSYGNAYSVNFDGTNVTITAEVPAVPEPGTYAMLMAGLLAVGFVARRRAAK